MVNLTLVSTPSPSAPLRVGEGWSHVYRHSLPRIGFRGEMREREDTELLPYHIAWVSLPDTGLRMEIAGADRGGPHYG
jgi:hypothetical protein